MKILELQSTIAKWKIHQRGSTTNVSGQKTESVNSNTGQLTLSCFRKRKKKNEEN